MKIITVVPTLTSGGAERVCLRLHQSLLNKGVESHLIVLSQQLHYDIHNIPNLHILALKNPKNIDLFFKNQRAKTLLQDTCNTIAQDSPIDAIYSHLDESHLLVAQLQTSALRFYVVHTSVIGELSASRRGLFKFKRLLKKKKVLNNQSIITVSEGLAEEIRTLDWLNPKSISCILNPLDAKQIAKESSSYDEATEVNDEYILHIGRYARAKRHDVLFDAFKKLEQRHPNLKLVLLTRLSKKLKRQLIKMGLTEKVITPGQVQNPYPWIRQAKLLVLSSDFEGFPNVLNEAIICETPVVSTDCPHGPKEILANFHPEWLVPCNAPQELADKIDNLLLDLPIVELDKWPLLPKVDPDYVINQYIALANK